MHGARARLAWRFASCEPPSRGTSTLERKGGARLEAIRRPDGKRARFDYDASGRLSGFTDEAGRRVGYGYDAYDRVEAHVDALGGVTRLGYDAMSNLTSLSDAKAQASRFEYDAFGRVEAMVDPMGGRDVLEYHPSGRLSGWTDRKGVRKSYSYDGLGRLRGVSFSDGSPAHTVAYDDLARTVTLANGTDTVTLGFDPAGRLVSETSALNGTTVSHTYTDDHLPETLSLDGTLLARYTHEAGYLQAIEGIAGRFSFGYDEAGRRSRLEFPNGLETAYDYDPTLGWLRGVRTSAAGAPVFEFAYTHDVVGNRLSRSEPGATEAYGYDAASRLVSVERTGGSASSSSFSYDAVGNRTREALDGNLRSFRYDARNRLLEAGPAATLRVSGTTSEPADVTVQGQPARMLPGEAFEADVPAVSTGDTELTVEARDASGNVRTNVYRVPAAAASSSFGYDPNGNLTSKTDGSGAWLYEWNAQNQLVRVTRDGSEVARFAYDPLGRRVRKLAGGTTYSFVYSGMDIVQETMAAAATTTTYRYVHGPGIDEPLARIDTASGAIEHYHADGLGSIARTTDTAGSVLSTRRYDAWGVPEPGSDQPGFAFTGREWDPETGLYYYRARYYDPRIGRFVSEDPIGFAGGVNFYAYVGGNPVRLADPFGLASVGDVVFFNWGGSPRSSYPHHAAIVTAVDTAGTPTRAFGGWGDTMTFHEADLTLYNGGVQRNIIGTGDMTDLAALALLDFIARWNGRQVAPDWNGDAGNVCIDVATAADAYGGSTLRDAMRRDLRANPSTYRNYGAGNPDPSSANFYRRNPWLQQFFVNTGRYTSYR